MCGETKQNGLAKQQTVIGFFKESDPYGEFSNFYTHAEPFEFVVPSFAQRSSFQKSCMCPWTEKAVMLTKALLFEDYESAQKIVDAETAKDAKALGRTVKYFDQATWNKHLEEIAYEVCRQKFTVDAHCKKVLLDTGDQVLAEASPWDKIWGIGIEVGDERVQDQSQWKGQNILGTALMQVRTSLRTGKEPNFFLLKLQKALRGCFSWLPCGL